MNPAFLDTSYVLAPELSNDQNHHAAVKHWHSMIKRLQPLITTSYVFDEIVTYLNSRGYHSKAVEVGNRILTSPSVQFVQVDEELFTEGWRYFQQHEDKGYSLTDCISSVVMHRLKAESAFAFDLHFIQAGFKKVP